MMVGKKKKKFSNPPLSIYKYSPLMVYKNTAKLNHPHHRGQQTATSLIFKG